MESAFPATILLLLSFVGLIVSGHFAAVTYGWIRGDSKWIPAFCRMDESTCSRVVDTPQARVFGLPNAVFGLAYYLMLLILVVTGSLCLTWIWVPACFAGLLTVGLSAYLAYSLRVQIRTGCRLCYVSHLLNLGIFLALLLACRPWLAGLPG